MRTRGFTLVELLVVLAIIAMLGGLLMPAVRKARLRGAQTKATSMISELELGLSMYQADHGTYPDGDNAALVAALQDVYVEFDEEDLVDGKLMDPWGAPYVYVKPGQHNALSVDLYSMGPDGEGDGTDADDLNNW